MGFVTTKMVRDIEAAKVKEALKKDEPKKEVKKTTPKKEVE